MNVSINNTHTQQTAVKNKKKKRPCCRICAFGSVFLVCLFLPAQAAAQTNAIVTVDKRVIVQGDRAAIDFKGEGGGETRITFSAKLQATTPPVALTIPEVGDVVFDSIDRNGVDVNQFSIFVQTYKNDDIGNIKAPRADSQPPPMAIHENTPFSVVLSSNAGDTFNGRNPLELCFTICTEQPCRNLCPIRLRLRVYLEGALR